jgi:hypothetical protein
MSERENLRRLAAKWRSQARHPQRQDDPGARAMLNKHADELLIELLRLSGWSARGENLTADEIHVLLDIISAWPSSGGAPWNEYNTEPGEDPKATAAGWDALRLSAAAKLETMLSARGT